MSEVLEIYLNSRSANYKYNNLVSHAKYNLPYINIGKSEKAYVSVKSAVIPYSFYNVNSINNKLYYTMNAIDYEITIPFGNYNVNTLKNELLLLLNAIHYNHWSITYISKTNKYKFLNTYYDFTLKENSTCFELLGFIDNYDYTSSSYILNSTISINVFTVNSLYICCDNFILNNIDSNSHNQSNIMASIPINSPMNSILFYKDSTKHLIHTVNNMSELIIKITDENGNLIEFNNINYSITLEITIIK